MKRFLFALSGQWADTYTTIVGIRHGAKEINPFMAHIVPHPVLFFGIKTAFPFLILFLCRKGNAVKQRRFLLAFTGVMGFIAAFSNLFAL
jgi:hypothetical protein